MDERRDAISSKTLAEEGLGWLLDSTFLRTFPAQERDEILGRMAWKTFEAGAVLLQAGREDGGCHLIVLGQAVIRQADVFGNLVPVAHVGPGSLVGERRPLAETVSPREVRAASPVKTLHLPFQDFVELFKHIKKFRKYIESQVRLRERWASLVSLLSRNPFLRALGTEDVERMLQSSELLALERGSVLASAGERGTEVFLIVKGRVGVYVHGPDGGPRQQISVRGPGELAGHNAVLLNQPRPADIEALEASEVLHIDGVTFMDIVTHNPLVQRHLLQNLATRELARAATALRKTEKVTVVLASSARGGLGATTLAYGVTAALRPEADLALVDLEGPETCAAMGFNVEDRVIGGVRMKAAKVPEDWKFPVVWPQSPAELPTLLHALRAEIPKGPKPETVLLVSGRIAGEATQHARQVADAIIQVRTAGDDFGDIESRRGQLRIQAMRIVKGVPLPFATSRKTSRVPDDSRSIERFQNTGNLTFLSTNATPFGRACCRLTRLLRGRSVGVALGGGGALGFAHVGLLRALESAGIPIDFVAGVSFGSLVGALYVGGGLSALERLVFRTTELTARVAAGFFTTRVIGDMVDGICDGQTLEETEIPFYPVGLDLTTGREFVLCEGTLGRAVRAASGLPGLFPPLQIGLSRVVDGGMINNVPASKIWEIGADFNIASNIIPPNPEGNRLPAGLLPANWYLGPVVRLDDTIRSLYMLMSQTGRDRTLLADYVFDLDIRGFNIYDFPRGEEIARAGEALARRLLPEILDAYQNLGDGTK